MSDKPKTSPLLFVGLATAALVVGILFSMYGKGPSEPVKLQSGTALPASRPIPALTLTDQDGKPFKTSDFKGKWSLLFFGYTHCPDICPNALSVMKQMSMLLDKDKDMAGKYRVVLVSVDPERDTPALLKKYLAYFNKHFIGITADHKSLKKLTAAASVVYMIPPEQKGKENYAVDHSAQIVILNPQGRLHGWFTGHHDARKIAADMRLLIKGK